MYLQFYDVSTSNYSFLKRKWIGAYNMFVFQKKKGNESELIYQLPEIFNPCIR